MTVVSVLSSLREVALKSCHGNVYLKNLKSLYCNLSPALRENLSIECLRTAALVWA
jgi:hypothetical protein